MSNDQVISAAPAASGAPASITENGRVFACETVAISNGVQVTLREMNGMQPGLARELATDKKGNMPFLPEAMLALSLVEINGQKVQRPNNIVAVQALMGQLSMPDVTRLMAAFQRLNGGDESGEDSAAE